MTEYDASTTTGDITRFEAFEYQDLADVAETVKTRFDDLTGVSPLWFSVEKDEDAGAGGHSLGSKRGGAGYEMFGDWRVEESLLDVFENESQAGSDKQEILKVVHALLATYDENGVKQRQGLEECVLAFETAIEGDLVGQLDAQAERCTQQWSEEKEKMEAANAGLTELEARTMAHLEGLGDLLKDRQSTVLAALRHEREANTRKILASALSDPLEEGRLLFERQVEETELEGRLKQRRRLLDLSSQGVQVQQEEIEAALLKAARDQVDNLMQVVDKMQNQQTKLLVTLQAEKKKVTIMRQHVSSRLAATSKNKTPRATTTAAEVGAALSRGKRGTAVKNGKVVAMEVEAADTTRKTTAEIAGAEDNAEGEVDGDAIDNSLGGENRLSGVDLLEACDRLENDNLRLRQRLAKLELQKMQKEHGEDDEDLTDDSKLVTVLETKRELQGQLKGLQMANEERSMELERARRALKPGVVTSGPPAATTSIENATTVTPETEKANAGGSTTVDEFKADTKTLTQKVKTLRRKLVFKLACKVMRRRFNEAGLGAGNDPNPPPGPVALYGFQAEAPDGHGLPKEMQLHAALLQQKLAVQFEMERAAREEGELHRAIEEAKGIDISGAAIVGSIHGAEKKNEDDDTGSAGRRGSDGGGIMGSHGRSRDGGDDGQGGSGDEEGEGDGVGGTLTRRRSSVSVRGGGVAGKSSVQTKSPEFGSARRVVDCMSRALVRMHTKVQRRLAALRTVAEKNEEAAQANEVDAVDTEAVEEVLRNEDIAREKALAVLDILCSRAMAKARARWLREALERSMKKTSSATSVAPATTGPASADVVTSDVGNEEGPHVFEGATPNDEEKQKDEQGGQSKSAVVTAPAPGGEEGVQKLEPLENATPSLEAEAVVAAARVGQAADAAEETATALRSPTAETVPVVAAEPEPPETAEAQPKAMAHGTPEEEAQAREDEECKKLFNMRAEKILLIKDLREKVKAAGGMRPRSMSQGKREHEMMRTMMKAEQAKLAKENKLVATEEHNKSIFKALPPKTKRTISNLRRQEVSLMARYELCVERIKKLLLNRGFSPAVALVADNSPDDNQPMRPRKWTGSERRKEAFLHSLTPQLERWRSRIIATTLVLEEEMARRDRVETFSQLEAEADETKTTSPREVTRLDRPTRGLEVVAVMATPGAHIQRGTPERWEMAGFMAPIKRMCISHKALKYYPPAASAELISRSVDGVDVSLESTVTPSTGTAKRRLQYYHSEPRLVSQSVLLSPRFSMRYERQPQYQQHQPQHQQHQPQQQQLQQQPLEADTRVGDCTIAPGRGSPQRPFTGGIIRSSNPYYGTEQQRRELLHQVHPVRPAAERGASVGHGGGHRVPSFGGVVRGGVVPPLSSPPSAASPSSPVKVPQARSPPLLVVGGVHGTASSLSVGQIMAQVFQQTCGENAMEPEESGGDAGERGEPESKSYKEAPYKEAPSVFPSPRPSPAQLVGAVRGTKISAPNTITAADAADTAASINNKTTPNQGAFVPPLSSRTSSAVPWPSQGRQSSSEGGGGGGERSLTDEVSVPAPTAMSEVPPQSSSDEREPSSSSCRDKQQLQQQNRHQSSSSRSRAGDHDDQGDQDGRHYHLSGDAGGGDADPVVAPTASVPLQPTQVATEWMEMEWKPFGLPPAATPILTLSRNREGLIPPELANIETLQKLYLMNNQLSGPIPPELGNLPALHGLDLEHNQLSDPIPPELGDIQALQKLNLGNNRLSGSIPRELASLSRLQTLWLSGNMLEGPIPPELGKLGCLEELSVSENELSGPIPPQLGNLSALEYLDVMSNRLHGELPSSLGRLRNLRSLYLHHNRLKPTMEYPREPTEAELFGGYETYASYLEAKKRSQKKGASKAERDEASALVTKLEREKAERISRQNAEKLDSQDKPPPPYIPSASQDKPTPPYIPSAYHGNKLTGGPRDNESVLAWRSRLQATLAEQSGAEGKDVNGSGGAKTTPDGRAYPPERREGRGGAKESEHLFRLRVASFAGLEELTSKNQDTLDEVRRLIRKSATSGGAPSSGTDLTDVTKLRELDRLASMAKALGEVASGHVEEKDMQQKEAALPEVLRAYCVSVRTGLCNAYFAASVVGSNLVRTSNTGRMGMAGEALKLLSGTVPVVGGLASFAAAALKAGDHHRQTQRVVKITDMATDAVECCSLSRRLAIRLTDGLAAGIVSTTEDDSMSSTGSGSGAYGWSEEGGGVLPNEASEESVMEWFADELANRVVGVDEVNNRSRAGASEIEAKQRLGKRHLKKLLVAVGRDCLQGTNTTGEKVEKLVRVIIPEARSPGPAPGAPEKSFLQVPVPASPQDDCSGPGVDFSAITSEMQALKLACEGVRSDNKKLAGEVEALKKRIPKDEGEQSGWTDTGGGQRLAQKQATKTKEDFWQEADTPAASATATQWMTDEMREYMALQDERHRENEDKHREHEANHSRLQRAINAKKEKRPWRR
eukprot:g5812.t1